MPSKYRSLLSSTSNTRDLGGYPTASGAVTIKNRIWRSDAPVIWNAADLRLLKTHGMTAILDLRTNQETEKHPCAYSGEKGFAYHHFPITAGSVPPPTLADVPVTYMDIASQKETAEILSAIAEAETGLLFCCTAGKDRTGVVSALLLLSCGVDRQTIIQDYTVSREYNRERLEKYLAQHPEVDRQIVLANEISMARFIEMFFNRFGCVEHYFEQIGLSPEHLADIQKKLLE